MPKTKKKFKAGVVLGKKYRDNITGIEGTAIMVTFHLHACEQVTLEYLNKDGDKSSFFTVDVGRLINVETGDNLEPGGKDKNGAASRPVASAHRDVT